MKLNKLFTALSVLALLATPVFAQEVEEVTEEVAPAVETAPAAEKKSGLPENLNISINVAVQASPASNSVSNSGTHFAPVTSFKPSIAGKIEPSVSYTIPTPLGENFLLKSANVCISDSVEVTPVTVKDNLGVSFTPLPFIVLSGSGQIGTGWDLMGNQGIAIASGDTYTSKTAAFYKWTAQGTFQFATGALTPNPWANIVMMYSYQLYQEGVIGAGNNNFCWQATYGKSNALASYQNGIVAYQMPVLEFVRVGAMWENDGYYGSKNTNTISPLCQLQFNKHNNLAIVGSIKTRNAETSTSDYNADTKSKTFTSKANGTEFYFDKVAFSYTYSF